MKPPIKLPTIFSWKIIFWVREPQIVVCRLFAGLVTFYWFSSQFPMSYLSGISGYVHCGWSTTTKFISSSRCIFKVKNRRHWYSYTYYRSSFLSFSKINDVYLALSTVSTSVTHSEILKLLYSSNVTSPHFTPSISVSFSRLHQSQSWPSG